MSYNHPIGDPDRYKAPRKSSYREEEEKKLINEIIETTPDFGKEEKKYFTPIIEDLCYGYECEILPINTKLGWKPTKLGYNKGYEDKNNPNSIYNLSPFWYGWIKSSTTRIIAKIEKLEHIRVPYLTKEQIEKEGWEKDGELYLKKKGKGLSTYKIIFGFIITKNKINTSLHITQEVNGNPFNIYLGECKDINTFRKICKLLNIK